LAARSEHDLRLHVCRVAVRAADAQLVQRLALHELELQPVTVHVPVDAGGGTPGDRIVGFDVERFDAAELENLVKDAFSQMRADLVWDVAVPTFEKPAARALLNLAQMAGAALPMGGVATVTVRPDGETLLMATESKGNRARLKAEMITVTGRRDRRRSTTARASSSTPRPIPILIMPKPKWLRLRR